MFQTYIDLHLQGVNAGLLSAETVGAIRDMTTILPEQHPPVNFGKIGVLLVNLGTPESTSYWDMLHYLREFLWDRRVIQRPRPPSVLPPQRQHPQTAPPNNDTA